MVTFIKIIYAWHWTIFIILFMTSVNFLVIISHWLLIVIREKSSWSKWRQVIELPIFKCQSLLQSYFPKVKSVTLSQCIQYIIWPMCFIKSNCLWYFKFHLKNIWPYTTLYSWIYLWILNHSKPYNLTICKIFSIRNPSRILLTTANLFFNT